MNVSLEVVLGAVFIFGMLFLVLYKGGIISNQLQEVIKNNQDLKIANEQLKFDLAEKINQKISDGQKEMNKITNLQFQESQKLIKDITIELSEVKQGGKQVLGFTEQLKRLQDILQNTQQRGALGEYFLETTIRNILPPENYQFQYSFKDGLIADAIIKLDKKILAIDAKFSLENYNKIVEENNPEKRIQLEKVFKEDLKKRIIETTKYIKPREGTMDFVFMFIPSEGIYYDLLISKIGVVDSRNFLEYAFREKRVIVVSPSTLYAYLQTIMQGLKALTIEKQASEIIKKVETLQKHLNSYKSYHNKLGNSISTVVNQYNTSNAEFTKIDKDLLKITGQEIDKKELKTLAKPDN